MEQICYERFNTCHSHHSELFSFSDPIPPSLGTMGTPTDLTNISVQQRMACIEVDILKCNSMMESEENINLTSSHFVKNQNSTSTKSEERVDIGREIICNGDQRSGTSNQAVKESIKVDLGILPNYQLPPQEVKMEGDAVLSSDIDREEIMADIEERLQTSLCLDQQNCEDEHIYGKSVDHNGQGNNGVSQTQKDEAHFTAASINYDASICHDGKEKESKTEHTPPSQLDSSTEKSSAVDASLSKLKVDLKHFSHLDSKRSHKKTTNVLNEARERRDCTKSSTKEEAVDDKLATSSEDEGNSSGSQSEEASSVDSNETDEGSDGLEFDKCIPSERVSEHGHYLPSVEQFEEDFEEYLENISNVVDNSIEKLPQSSEFSGDGCIYSEYKLHADFKDDSHNGTPTETYVTSQLLDTHLDTCHQMSHHNSYSTGYCYEQNYSAYHDNVLSEGGWNSLYPSTGFCDQYNWLSNHTYYRDQSYNNYSPFYGHHAANWWANVQTHSDSASSQQCLGQFNGDIGSHQDYQWNTSWYNAYQRQTGCIRQFVSFSRSARM